MGIGPKSCSLTPPNSGLVLPNPNPARFEILRTRQIGTALVAEVRYPDCTNYEGRKILVYAGTSDFDLRTRATLDPHFAEGGGPVARFKPTVYGWHLATTLAQGIGSHWPWPV